MDERDEYESPAFSSKGHEAFPNTYEDNRAVRNFSEESKWTTKVLTGRLAVYEAFLNRADIMPRAQGIGRRIREHLMFELLYRDGFFNYLNEDDESEK